MYAFRFTRYVRTIRFFTGSTRVQSSDIRNIFNSSFFLFKIYPFFMKLPIQMTKDNCFQSNYYSEYYQSFFTFMFLHWMFHVLMASPWFYYLVKCPLLVQTITENISNASHFLLKYIFG